MESSVSIIRPASKNPATNPVLGDALKAELVALIDEAQKALADAANEFGSGLIFANSLGAEDVVITALGKAAGLNIDSFTLDTGRLPAETYALLDALQKRYENNTRILFPHNQAVEAYVAQNGINGFYNSIEQRKACCAIRKLEPLSRALAGRTAWVTGLRRSQAATRTEVSIREFDEGNKLVKISPLANWDEKHVWAYIRLNEVPYNALHDQHFPSIGCAPCTRAISMGEDIRAGRWWWENPDSKECGLHSK